MSIPDRSRWRSPIKDEPDTFFAPPASFWVSLAAVIGLCGIWFYGLFSMLVDLWNSFT